MSDVPVNEKRLCSIAGCHVLSFGVDDNGHCLFDACGAVNVHVAYSVGMSHYRNSGIVHDVLNESIRTARYEQINVFVHFNKLINAGTVFNEYRETFGHA